MEKISVGVVVGNRDIQIREENASIQLLKEYGIKTLKNHEGSGNLIIDKSDKNFKEYSRYLFNNFNKFEKYFETPLVSKVFKYFEEDKIIDKFYLYPTNQGHNLDTIYVAKIISCFFNNSEIIPIEEDPRNISLMKHFFDKKIDFSKKNFIQASSGVPAVRAGLYLSSLFHKNVEVIELIDEKISYSNKNGFEKEILKNKIIDDLKNYNYESACQLFNMGYPKKFARLARIINNRINFNLNQGEYKDINNSFNDISRLYFFNNVCSSDDEYKIRFLELFNSIIIRLKKEQYLDFISRLYSFEDNLYQYLITTLYKQRFGVDLTYKDKESFFECKSNQNNVLVFLKNEFKDLIIDNHLIDYPNVKVRNGRLFYFYMLKMILARNDEEKGPYNKIKIALDFVVNNFIATRNHLDFQTKNIMSLRNKTIVAHGLKGVNEDSFKDYFKFDEFEKSLEKFYEDLFEEKFINIFDEINNFLISKINSQ